MKEAMQLRGWPRSISFSKAIKSLKQTLLFSKEQGCKTVKYFRCQVKNWMVRF